jgi:hypothetical protein
MKTPLVLTALLLALLGFLAATNVSASPFETEGAAQKKLLVIESPVALSADAKVLPGQTLRVEPGGMIEIPEGVKLTIEGRLEAGAYQIFSGDGTLTGPAKIHRIYPEWFFDGAYNDESVDWAPAINRALRFAAENCRSVFLGPNVYNVNRTVDMSSRPGAGLNRPGMRLEGALRNSEYNKGTTILGNTGPGGAILETTDSDGLHVINIALRAGTRTPSTIGLLQARGTGTGWGGDHVYDNLFVGMGSDPKANGGAGTIGVFNLAAEETRYENLQVWANLPLVFSWSHTFLLTNPELDGKQRSVTIRSSLGLPLADQASPTCFALTGMGRLIALDAVSPVVLLAVTATVDIGNTFMQRRPGSPDGAMAGSYNYAVENWNCYQFRHFGSAEGIATYLLSRRDLTEADIHVRLAPVQDASKPAIQLFDDGGNYQLRNVRLMLDALGVDRPLIRFDKFPLNPNGGFKIVNPDFHSNLTSLQGIRIDKPENP